LVSQKVILASGITAIAVVVAILGAMVFLNAASAATSPSTSTQSNNFSSGSWMGRGGNFSGPFQGAGPQSFFNGGRPPHNEGFPPFRGPPANLTVGQTIVLTSTNGSFRAVNDPSNNGTASGKLTLTVTGKLSQGYTFSITSGTISIEATQYTISSGSAQTGLAGNSLQGQGGISSSSEFMIRLQARGNLAGTEAHIQIDMNAGSTEYLVNLLATIQS